MLLCWRDIMLLCKVVVVMQMIMEMAMGGDSYSDGASDHYSERGGDSDDEMSRLENSWLLYSITPSPFLKTHTGPLLSANSLNILT